VGEREVRDKKGKYEGTKGKGLRKTCPPTPEYSRKKSGWICYLKGKRGKIVQQI